MVRDEFIVYCHESVLDSGSYVTSHGIVVSDGIDVRLLDTICPHKGYRMHNIGASIEGDIVCRYHGARWKDPFRHAVPAMDIYRKDLRIDATGLVIDRTSALPLTLPTNVIDDLKSIRDKLSYDRTCSGDSVGSWLWMMDTEADMLHVRKDGIHPGLVEKFDASSIKLTNGTDWILQTHEYGWWLYIFPFTFIECERGVGIAVNSMTPHDKTKEYGFKWTTQFSFLKGLSTQEKNAFILQVDEVYREDITAIERLQWPYFSALPTSHLEEHCTVFGEWVSNNVSKTNLHAPS